MGVRPGDLTLSGDDERVLTLLGAITVKTEAFPGVQVDVRAPDLPVLPAAVEVAAYRIAIEALTNVARHSAATRARVDLRLNGDSLAIDICDNGRTDAAWVPRVGLTSMKERVDELGGTLSYANTPTGGTVEAQLPLSRWRP